MPADNGDPNPWGNSPGEPPRPVPKPARGSVPGTDRPAAGPNWTRPAMPHLDDPSAVIARLLARFGGGNGSNGLRGRGSWLAGGRALLLVGLVLLALWLASGFYRVEPDEAGVVQRFGRFVRLTPPGLNYHLPWPVESVQLPSVTRINRVEIGYRSASADAENDTADTDTSDTTTSDTTTTTSGTQAGGVRQVGQESLMLTGDENIIDINFAVFWRISDAGKYLFAVRDPDLSIKDVSESVMREVLGRTPIQPALTDARARIEADVLAKAQTILDRYGAGIELTQVQLQKVDPPAEVIDSFRDVQRANTEAERMVNEAQAYSNNIVPRARGDAAAITAAGQGARAAAVAQATGDARRFESVLAAYQAAPDITLKRLYIETMQDVLSHAPSIVIDNQVKNTLPLLPLTTPSLPGATP